MCLCKILAIQSQAVCFSLDMMLFGAMHVCSMHLCWSLFINLSIIKCWWSIFCHTRLSAKCLEDKFKIFIYFYFI